jgi:hypothetical protein
MSDPLAAAGEAAQMLDEMGFHAVARKRDGVVTLETWGKGRALRVIVNDGSVSPGELVRACLSELQSPVRARVLH